MHLLDRVATFAKIIPDRVAHQSGDRALTYGELARRSDAVAAYLVSIDPDDRTPVAVIGHKEPEMLVAFLGAVKAGRPYVPIDTALPQQRIDRIIEHAVARIILTPAIVAALPSAAPVPAHHAVGPDDPFYIIFTSGSTGEPKGVVITYSCLTTFVEWMLAEHPFVDHREVFLNQAPFSFDLSVMDLYLSLATGGTLWSITRDQLADPRLLFPSLAQSGITTWVSTPSCLQLCLADRSFNPSLLPAIRRFLFCGETLAPDAAAHLIERFPQAEIWNTYGPTEATVATTSVRIDRDVIDRWTPLPVGYPMPGSRVFIADEHDRPLPDGTSGQIIIAGANVSPGYFNMPEQTARAFFTIDGRRAYRTGDQGHIAAGMVFFAGRMDNQIKLHGYRIELGDIEAGLCALPGVRDAVVLPVIKRGQAESLAAFVLLSESPNCSTWDLSQKLRSQLSARLPAYMLPRRFHLLTTFPMTTNGKADRRQLATLLA
ncbi:MAG: D-alanine--poly(phosphoribitol) ligase subunit DltA [Herpetosiphon sp.]